MSDRCEVFGTTRICIVQFVFGFGPAVPLWWKKWSLRAPPRDRVEAAGCSLETVGDQRKVRGNSGADSQRERRQV